MNIILSPCWGEPRCCSGTLTLSWMQPDVSGIKLASCDVASCNGDRFYFTSKAVWCRKVESSRLVYYLRFTNSISFTASGTQVSMWPRGINNVVPGVYPYVVWLFTWIYMPAAPYNQQSYYFWIVQLKEVLLSSRKNDYINQVQSSIDYNITLCGNMNKRYVHLIGTGTNQFYNHFTERYNYLYY